MSKDEAMKMALEALEFDGFTPEDATHRSYHAKAITALKQALEQLEPAPVAWIIDDDLEEVRRHGRRATLLHSRPITNGIETPLYTSPPKREPLTDEELKDALVSVDPETKRLPPGFRDFARAIEAKLMEKNT